MNSGVRVILAIALACFLGCSSEDSAVAEGDDPRNAQPQDEYPVLSIEQQRTMMARIEKLRSVRRVKDLRGKTPPADWIAIAYHGLVLDANHDIIPMDPATIAAIQESMYSVIAPQARENILRKHGRDPQALFMNQELQGFDRLFVRGEVLEALLAESPEAIRDRYEWRYRLLKRATDDAGERPLNLRPGLLNQLRSFQLEDDPTPADAPPSYVETCRAAGVPIPPDWPDPKWINQGALALQFVSGNLSTEVFAYKDPAVPGVCYALPRRDTTGSIQLLGIICQSATTGKACFWDNKEPDNTPITGNSITLKIADIANGMNLVENCTNCHRGDNVFNIHPGTALDLGRAGAPGGPYDTSAAVRYTPIAQSGWSNPGPLTLGARTTGQSSCTGCHDLPETKPDYCAAVLEMAALATMPPFGPNRAGWPPNITNAKYTDHITELAKCP
jgi:hypothetical protein